MILLTEVTEAGWWLAACAGFFTLQVFMASRFLHGHGGPPLTWHHILPVALIFLCTVGWLITLPVMLPQTATWRAIALLILAVPLTLTDLRCQWLPMRYTVMFWLGGLAAAALPGSVQPLLTALLTSCSAFCLSAGVRWLANFHNGDERIGLGDVYLMAGLCAWLPWRSACYAAAGGLLLCCFCALLTRQPSKPFAPALFSYLCGVCIFFPQYMEGVL